MALSWQRKAAEHSIPTRPGVYCLRTDLAGWDTQRLWSTYLQLTGLEAVFRSLKSESGPRPIYHWKPQRKATQAEPGQLAIYDKLGVSASPGEVRKLIS